MDCFISPNRSSRRVLTGTDFFTVEVLTWRCLTTYYVLFFIQLETRCISLAGFTRHPTSEWMVQMARNGTDEASGFLHGQRYLLHDRDTKFSAAFQDVLRSSGILPLTLPPRSPNLNAFSERWVRSIKLKNASPNSFCSGKLRCAGQSPNISIIIILNETIRARIIFSSSLPRPDRQVLRAATFDVEKGSVACLGLTPMPLDSLTLRVCN